MIDWGCTSSTRMRNSADAPWRWPDFLGIGIPKAGTTWLYVNLYAHPAIWMPPFKELQYFNGLYVPGHGEWTRAYRREQVGNAIIQHVNGRTADKIDFDYLQRQIDFVGDPPNDDWYGRIFARAPIHTLCGEITPEYCLLPDAAIDHLLRQNPRMKFLLLLRDPVARTWSDIRMALRQQENASLRPEDIWSSHDVRYPENYLAVLSAWRSRCPLENFLVEFLDHIALDPMAVLQRVCDFLRIPFQQGFFPNAHEIVHAGHDVDMPPALYDEMRSYFRDVIVGLAAQFPDPCARWAETHFG